MSFKAIVVFYLPGGHDSHNMLVPLKYYDDYAKYRGEIAHDESTFIPLKLGHDELAMNGYMPRMANRIISKKALPILSTGNLIEPTNLDSYTNKSVDLPRFLFSHSHQKSFNRGALDQTSGWGGRVLDAWYQGQGTNFDISPAITTSMDRDLVSSETLSLSQILNEGESSQGITGNRLTSVISLSESSSYEHVMERVAQGIIKDSINGQAYLHDLFSQYESSGKLPTTADVAAKLIAASGQLGHSRQIIHINASSWDTHSDQFNSMNEKYEFIDALFNDFIEQLEDYGVAENVVCVTASEFGRSLRPNNRGTDHGWGSNQLVWGHPIVGSEVYGEFTHYDDPKQWTNSKRLIPTISDSQTYSTIAKWFGLSEVDILKIFPELANFEVIDLGFFESTAD